MGLVSFLRTNIRYLSAGVLLTFSSSYGQTYFIALFAAQIMAAYSLTDGQWGAIYSIATTSSAVVMFWAGALTDRFRARALAWFVMPGLAIVCLAMMVNTSVILLILIIFFLRFLGQGMMSQLATVSMARWFSGRRGLALSIAAMGFAIGQATLPVAVASLFEIIEWRRVWLFAAGMLLLVFPLVLKLLAAERTPQSLAKEETSLGMNGRHWTRADVLKSGIFWLMVPMLLGPPSWGTALFFQQVHIAEVKDWPLIDYLALLPLLTAISIATTLVSGQLIDRYGSGPIIRIYLLPWVVGLSILALAESLFTAAIAFSILGLGMGLQATVVTSFWAEYFGTRYIGSIKAVSTSTMVLGTAIGPGVTGAFIDWGYDFPSQMLAIAGYFIAAAALVQVAVHRASRNLKPPKVDV